MHKIAAEASEDVRGPEAPSEADGEYDGMEGIEVPAPLAHLFALPPTSTASFPFARSTYANPLDDVEEDEDGHQYDENGEEILFSAGSIEDTARARLVHQLDEYGLWGEYEAFLADGEDDSDLANVMNSVREMGLEDESDTDDDDDVDPGVLKDSKWFPYPTKTMFVLDMMDSVPRRRFSSSQLELVMWAMRLTGSKDVPSFKKLRKVQAALRQKVGVPTMQYVSARGAVFYGNSIKDCISKDFSNPLICDDIELYAEDTVGGSISESWQAEKILGLSPDLGTPMWADHNEEHYYNRELSMLRNGTYIIPLRWVKVGTEIHADGIPVDMDLQTGSCVPRWRETIRVKATDFIMSYPQIVADDTRKPLIMEPTIYTDDAGKQVTVDWAASMPNPLRARAGGKRLYTSHIKAWGDDVSGNQSKQYNAHNNIYFAHANLPHKKLSQEYFVRFTSTSTHATSLEQFNAVSEQIRETHLGEFPTAYHAGLGMEICFRILIHNLPADNPQQSTECSHIGMGGNRFCRRCHVGGTDKEKERMPGYDEVFRTGVPRTPAETLQEVKDQLTLAQAGYAKSNLGARQTRTGVKDSIAEYFIQRLVKRASEMRGTSRRDLTAEEKATLRQEFSDIPGDKWNKLLELYDLALDVHRDSPDELLHIYLLGQVKYVWHGLHTNWGADDPPMFVLRLDAACLKGLSIPPIRAKYIMQYKNGLIGKHFKTMQQLLVFQVHGLKLSDLQFELIKATGELAAMLWFPTIRNMDQYLVDLQILIDNVLDLWSLIDPGRVLDKGKLHVLLHIVDDIRRMGPGVLYATEIFECFNAVFRMCSILSNHQAPSRDIARQFSHLEGFKHIASGGFWYNNEGRPIQASKHVRSFMETDKRVRQNLGWFEEEVLEPGYAKLKSSKKRGSVVWRETPYAQVTPPFTFNPDTRWHECDFVVSQSQDKCDEGTWVFANGAGNKTVIGRTKAILQMEAGAKSVVVILEPYVLGEAKHSRFNMPKLKAPEGRRLVAFLPKDILFAYNVQHDCCEAQCAATGSRPVIQERLETAIMEPFWEHKDDDHFVLNMHALHNANLIRETLPRSLTAPKHYLADRLKSHTESSATLSRDRDARRAKTTKKREATAKKKAREKAAGKGNPTRKDAMDVEDDEAAAPSDDEDTGLDSCAGQRSTAPGPSSAPRKRKKRGSTQYTEC
ncbi:hypothetical protein BOTBODRAFT_182090 [Botryobasidium botryosum FD-172 SS1]|uniref:Uncharacterized protein n=1 Tax=Botryobasidium botryosum (strain FD-172 SS1) TaxID=930990 RepID=A0A067M2X7_BOTB1|nr:hypothetical protein BOTBODRAFT_182090 [Botryobasidium botryosum FD-172 SS1]